MLTCEKISLTRDGRELFRDLSFTLFAGSCLVITGGNGSGKTSLLRIMAGLDKPDGGAVIWDGELIEESTDFLHELLAIWHENTMKDRLTVAKNLRDIARHNDTEAMLQSAIYLWQLEGNLDVKYKKLSKGWQRRVELARLLLNTGKLWLLDEPMAGLDKAGVDMMENLIKSRCDQHGVVVVTSHIELDLPNAIHLNIEDFSR